MTFRGPTPEDEFFGIVARDGAMIMFKALGEIVDGGLFRGHGVGIRMRPDGSFQEAVVEG